MLMHADSPSLKHAVQLQARQMYMFKQLSHLG